MFSDPFDDQTRWSVSDSDTGRVAYTDGALSIVLTEDGAVLHSSRIVPEPVPVMRVEAAVTLSPGDGAAGLGCGTGGDAPDHLVGMLTADGTWLLASVTGGIVSQFAEGPLPPEVEMTGGGSAHLGVECASTGTDAGDRIAMWVDGQLVADATSGSSLGAWDRATAIASARRPTVVAFFDDAVVSTGDRYAPMDADPVVLDLMDHVPSAWREACTARRPVGEEGLLAGLVCAPAGAAVQAEYYRYSSQDALDSAFSARLEQAAGQSLDLGDCALGPSLLSWSVPGGSEGRIACFDNRDTLGGRQVLWTDAQLGILALGVRTDGGYAELYDWWLGAGPE